ncbi:MAG: polyketide synthase family protein, partial [Mucilaginibacter sp.]|nr:polyketide synthase family protein [Mucilaginibacter sp.]
MQAINLVDLLKFRSEKSPERTAYVYLKDGEDQAESFSYLSLYKRVLHLAGCIQRVTKKGDRVLLIYNPGLDYVVAFFACLFAGVVAIPVYPPRKNRSLERLDAIISDAKANLVLTTSNVAPNFEKHDNNESKLQALNRILSDLEKDENWQNYKEITIDENSIAYLQYTSGSTGTPKGVMVTHKNIIYNLQDLDATYEHSENSVMVTWLPIFHDLGLIYGLLQPLYNGFPCYLMAPASFIQRPLRWLEAISKYKGTHSPAPNFAYSLCCKNTTTDQIKDLDLSSWEMAMIGTEPVRVETMREFSEKYKQYGFRSETFTPAYGLAESTLKVSTVHKSKPVTFLSVNSAALEKNLVVVMKDGESGSQYFAGHGSYVLDTKIIIVDPETTELSKPGCIGEIWIGGPACALGYWKKEKETEEVFKARLKNSGDGPFLRTGDLGFYHNDELFITGRLKDLIIIRGLNHYPQDIEVTAEKSHPALKQDGGAAFSIEVSGKEQLVIVQEVNRGHLSKLNAEEVFTAIRKQVSLDHDLQVYAISLLMPASLPKTSSGKIQRRACKQAFTDSKLTIVAEWVNNTPAIDLLNEAAVGSNEKFVDSKTIEAWITALMAKEMNLNPATIKVTDTFEMMGMDSLFAAEMTGALGSLLSRKLEATLVYNYPTIRALANYLSTNEQLTAITAPQEKNLNGYSPIAIVGMGCRFPMADNPEAFWELLKQDVSAVRKLPEGRWEEADLEKIVEDKTILDTITWGGFLNKPEEFDPLFFGISPREASAMDPQQRLLLEVAWEALENAGKSPSDLPEYKTGIYIGISNNDYQRIQSNSVTRFDQYAGTGNAASIAANRLSYFLNLKGPSMSIDTACSSSLVSIHQACQSLRTGEIDTALAGGVNLILSPELSVVFAKAGMLAPDGKCKTFDAAADGYVRGEGCGIIVLKRLEDAIADGDRIQAVIRGTAINQDGRSNGITAPNGPSQVRVIRQALANAGVSATEVSYLEAHGTGTSLGDPIEVNSFSSVLLEGRHNENPCMVGSVKTHIGHLESAAGIAGVIKLILALQHKEIPPHINFSSINPLIEWDDNRLKIAAKQTNWDFNNGKRIAAVSSFGFGGTNAHAIIEEAPEVTNLIQEPTVYILAISGRDMGSLRELAERYVSYLEGTGGTVELSSVCYTAGAGRSHFSHRLGITGTDAATITAQLKGWLSGKTGKGVYQGESPQQGTPQQAWLFTGQGSQYAGMGRALYEEEPVFRSALDRCSTLFSSYHAISLLEVLYPEKGNAGLINDTTYSQPALFSLGWSLAQLWQHWGISPDLVLGHSVGEYTAACVAGVFSLEDGMKLVVNRGQLMGALSKAGGMMNVYAGEDQLSGFLKSYKDKLWIAALNSPQQTVISGESASLDALETTLEKTGIKTVRLEVSHAFHSGLMEPVTAPFMEMAGEIQYNKPAIPVISLVSGELAGEEITTAAYWAAHVLAPVNFRAGMATLAKAGIDIYLELGPKAVLLPLGMQCLNDTGKQPQWQHSLRREKDGREQLSGSLAGLYAAGCAVNWEGFLGKRKKVQLPTYPFQRSRYWVTTEQKQEIKESGLLSRLGATDLETLRAELGITLELEDGEAALLPRLLEELERRYSTQGNPVLDKLLYRVNWEAAALQAGEGLNGTPGNWLLFMDNGREMQELSAALTGRGAKVKEVAAGQAAEHYKAIVEAALQSGITGIVYGRGLDLESGATAGPIVQELVHLQALIRTLAGMTATARLWVLSQGGQVVNEKESTVAGQSALSGLTGVLGSELPQWQPVMIDYRGPVSQLLPELGGRAAAERVAYRDGKRYAAKLEEIRPKQTTKTFKADQTGSYLVSGGTGALGIATAGWLSERGAGEILLLSRKGTTVPEALEKQARQTGTIIRIVQGDVGNRSDMEALFKTIRSGAMPLKGIIHAAGTLADGLLENLDSSSFEQVLHPKAAGGWLLHELTANKPLDFFVCYSSAAAVLGFAGQGNYAAANSYMEGLCSYRRSQGLAGTVISWGPWAAGGMAAALGSADRARMQRMGVNALTNRKALAALDYVLTAGETSAGVFEIDWEQYIKEAGHKKHLLSKLVKQEQSGSTMRQELE